MPYLLLGIAALIGAVLMARWFVSTPPAQIATAVRWGLGAVAVALGGYLVLSRQWMLAPIILFGLLPWLARMRLLRNLMKGARGPTPGRTSSIETRYLRMRLDHDSGNLAGEVLAGAFAGRTLDSLDRAELIALLRESAAEDEQSAQVLVAYLDRAHPDWREYAAGGPMSREEAIEILGVGPDARPQEIKDAHRRLMNKNHPDRGGSTYIAAKINQAKDVLLGG